MLSDLYVGESVKSVLQCKSEYKLTETDCLRYTQLRHWATHRPHQEAATRDKTNLEKLFPKLVGSSGHISAFYKVLVGEDTPAEWGHNCK